MLRVITHIDDHLHFIVGAFQISDVIAHNAIHLLADVRPIFLDDIAHLIVP